VLGQHGEGQVVETDGPLLVGLGPFLGPATALGLVDRPGDGQGPPGHVEIGPPEGAQLAPPGPGEGTQQQQGSEGRLELLALATMARTSSGLGALTGCGRYRGGLALRATLWSTMSHRSAWWRAAAIRAWTRRTLVALLPLAVSFP